MGDLDLRTEPLDLAADQPLRAHRVLALDPPAQTSEIDQGQRARAVKGPPPPRLGGVAGRLIGLDRNHEGLDRALDGRLHPGGLSVDQAVGRQKGHVPHHGAGKLGKQRRNPRPHALQRVDRGEQGVQNLRTHGGDHSVAETAARGGLGAWAMMMCGPNQSLGG